LLALALAEQDLLVELAGRAGGADPFDDDVVLVPRQVTQDALEGLLRIAVRLDIELVEELAGLELDEGALGRGAAAVDAKNDLGRRRDRALERLAALMDARETLGQRGCELPLLATVLGDVAEWANRGQVLFPDGFERCPEATIPMVFGRGWQPICVAGSADEVVEKAPPVAMASPVPADANAYPARR
jgi:hypothetical protein